MRILSIVTHFTLAELHQWEGAVALWSVARFHAKWIPFTYAFFIRRIFTCINIHITFHHEWLHYDGAFCVLRLFLVNVMMMLLHGNAFYIALLTICHGNPLVTTKYIHKGPAMHSLNYFFYFFLFSLNMLLKKFCLRFVCDLRHHYTHVPSLYCVHIKQTRFDIAGASLMSSNYDPYFICASVVLYAMHSYFLFGYMER